MKQGHSRLIKCVGALQPQVWGMPPRKISKIRCSEIESEDIFHNIFIPRRALLVGDLHTVPIANLYTC